MGIALPVGIASEVGAGRTEPGRAGSFKVFPFGLVGHLVGACHKRRDVPVTHPVASCCRVFPGLAKGKDVEIRFRHACLSLRLPKR